MRAGCAGLEGCRGLREPKCATNGREGVTRELHDGIENDGRRASVALDAICALFAMRTFIPFLLMLYAVAFGDSPLRALPGSVPVWVDGSGGAA